MKEKKQTLDELNGIHKRLENEYKQIVLYAMFYLKHQFCFFIKVGVK